MKWVRIVAVVTLASFFSAPHIWAKNQESSQAASNVSIEIEPIKTPIHIGDKIQIKVTIQNNTSEFLVLSYVPDLSTFHFHIRDVDGNTPKETDEGCRMHRSIACSAGRPNGTVGSIQQLRIQPGKEKVINADVGREYLINYASTFTIDLTESDFVMVTAPKDADMMDLGKYPSRRLGTVQSNSTKLQVTP